MRIAIIDIIGIPYDGTTVFKQGLGGSESAVTLNARELARLGFSVTVFNRCDVDHAQPGVYEGVEYVPLERLREDWQFDVVISSRTVIPFTDPADYDRLGDRRSEPFRDLNLYDRILSKAAMRILWMHDTFCLGDGLIEELAVKDRITDIFTLSDWHLNYITNCDHGRRRNYEVLKPRLFLTRNGAHRWLDEVDVAAKDPNHYVYNASVTKGMIPLVRDIWPHIKRWIPQARLTVIGGYYRFSSSDQPDQQEQDWRAMADDSANQSLDITFTGIIPQKEIADILANARAMLYPAAFPETYGISTLESLLYNTPVITCRFGALEETALNSACYLIDYAIEPNGLFPNIDRAQQVEQFVKTVVEQHRNPYLHQQKQWACEAVKQFSGWDTVALQWTQHIYKRTGRYLPRDLYQRVDRANTALHKIYGRRFHNTVELAHRKSNTEQNIVVVSPMYNNQDYVRQCVESVITQDYDRWQLILIDDASTDDTVKVVAEYVNGLPQEIKSRVYLTINETRRGAVHNQVDAIRQCADDAIIMLLDGDDSLVNDNTIFNYYNTLYHEGAEFTYGSCWSLADSIPLVAQPYPRHIRDRGEYRHYRFNWGIPYTHLRTFRKHLINGLADQEFQQEGEWVRAGGDAVLFYALIEQAKPDGVRAVADIVVNYNDLNPINDYKVNQQEQTVTAQRAQKKRILIAIPTARNIEPSTFKAIYDLKIPDGYTADFQYFYGYNIDQIRNLIADWTVKGYDYLFAVDSDIAFASDTLAKFLSYDVDVVSGIYIQRIPGTHNIEIYESTANGGTKRMSWHQLQGQGLTEVAGCGFGCVLVKREVFEAVGYPQFEYFSALDHNNTVSEDTDFCRKARDRGFKIWADPTVCCEHTGSFTFRVDKTDPLLDNGADGDYYFSKS